MADSCRSGVPPQWGFLCLGTASPGRFRPAVEIILVLKYHEYSLLQTYLIGVKVMNLKCWSMMLLILVSVMSSSVYAVSLECNGNIVSTGITEEQLLNTCGEPTSRNGANWVYRMPGSIPIMVTFGNGVVMFIRDVESEDSPASPLGDHP